MNQEIESLLYQNESNTLDFKREQYKFINGSPDSKSQLLKDVLALVNSWRKTDSYILIGIEENKGGRATVVGETNHIDDAILQQFINEKLNKNIHFKYDVVTIDGLQVGVIHIPLQQEPRPFYTKNDYGSVKKYQVFMRIGSSTTVASPDDIIKMGLTYVQKPSLQFGFYDEENEKLLSELTIVNQHFELTDPEEFLIKEDIKNQDHLGVLGGMIHYGESNPNYYKDAFRFYNWFHTSRRIVFALYNDGSILLSNPKAVLKFNDLPSLTVDLDEIDYPPRIINDYLLIPPGYRQNTIIDPNPSISIKWKNGYSINILFDDSQPKSYNLAQYFYIGGINIEIPILATIYADNLPDPLKFELILRFNTEIRSISSTTMRDTINKFAKRRYDKAVKKMRLR